MQPVTQDDIWTKAEQARPFVISRLRLRFGAGLTPDDFDEVFQEALISLWQYRARAAEIRKPLGLLVSIAYKRCQDLLRRKGEHPLQSLSGDVEGRAADDLFEVLDLLLLLPEPHQEIVRLRFIVGLTFQEIASCLGSPLSTVYSHCAEAIATLREHFGLPPK